MTARGEMIMEQPSADTLKVILSGHWNLGGELPGADKVQQTLEGRPGVRNMVFDTRELAHWDTGLLTFLINVGTLCSRQNIRLNRDGLPPGAKRLLEMALAVPEKKDARQAEERVSFLSYLGNETVALFRSAGEMLEFIGDAVIAVQRLLRGKAQYRRSDLGLIMQAVSAQALPIVSLICFLVGLILAFIGAIQLQLFGAQIYVADLVGIAMVRLMAAIMTGIVMAGRTGGGLCRAAGDHAGKPGDRCPENPGHIAHGVPGAAAYAGPRADDAPVVPLRQYHGHIGGHGGGGRDAQYRLYGIL
jgi:phospholipid/cholesterol/gamma-HCH transport system permease protein